MPSTTFSYTGAVQTWVVPVGVTSVEVELWGAEGGARDAGTQGRGGYVKGVLAVTPGETLRFYVGQKPTSQSGGWNGGGPGQASNSDGEASRGGGGATDVRQGGTSLSARKAVAGGGGGEGGYSNWISSPLGHRSRGGSGGTTTGQRGQSYNLSPGPDGTFNATGGGYGGSQSSGGAAQGSGQGAGTAGSQSVGGTGGLGFFIGGGGGTGHGGGGGGGYYCGGGGSVNEPQGNGGGGGSNYTEGLTGATSSRGVRSGHGQAVVTWSEVEPLAPTSVQPVSGATISTDLPSLSASMPTHPAGSVVHQRVEWQLATDSGFTANVRTVTQDVSALKSSGTQTMTVPGGSALFQSTWHIRARIIEVSGTPGPWSGSHTFTVAHAPSTTNHSPTGGSYSVYGTGDRQFSWTFTDPSPVDFQTAYEVEVQRTDGTAVVSSGQVVSGNQNATLAIPSGEKDNALRWRVRVRDRDEVWSTFSSWHLFRMGDIPVAGVIEPVGEIATANPLVRWTFAAGGTRQQTHFQVRFRDDEGFIVYDTNWTASTGTQHQVPQPVLENTSNYTVEVRVRDNAGLESSFSIENFNTDWTFVESPLFQVDDLYGTEGYVSITWDDDRHDDDFFYYRVWRREVVPGAEDGDGWKMLVERSDQPGYYEYHDWLAASGTTYEYAVTQAANRFGDIVESERFPIEATPTSDHYWLIHPLFEEFTVRVDKVTSEDFDEVYEQESVHVLGRGRHVDYGDRLGYTGSITAQFRDYEDGLSAREQRVKLEGIKASRQAVYLRNPFGDVWQVAVGDLGIGRVAGVGRREFFDVTIPYEEVL